MSDYLLMVTAGAATALLLAGACLGLNRLTAPPKRVGFEVRYEKKPSRL